MEEQEIAFSFEQKLQRTKYGYGFRCIFSLSRKGYFVVSIFSVKLEANSSADREGFQSFGKNGELTFFHEGMEEQTREIGQNREEDWRVHCSVTFAEY